MSLLGTAIKGGIAKKALDIARKPENQARVKEMVRSISGKGGRGRRSGRRADPAGRRR